MFGLFKRNKPNKDPLSDIKTLTRWIQDLPAGDIYSAQKAVLDKLLEFNQISQSEQVFNKERLQVLMGLDEQTREIHTSLCAQYLRNPRMSKIIENRLWNTIHAFILEVTHGYHAFLMNFVANPGARWIQSMLPTITARTIRGMSDVMKWRYFHYQPSEQKHWLRLHNVYRIAEFEGFASQKFQVYDTDTLPSSCTEEYTQALLMSLIGFGSLPARKIEMIDHWLDNWTDNILIEPRYQAEKHAFYVDTSQGSGLRRIRNSSTESAVRYLDTTPLINRINAVKTFLKAGKTPASLGLGEDFRLPDGYELLDLVSNEFSPVSQRERRTESRETDNGRWDVIRDLNNILRLFHHRPMQSESGLRAHLTPEEILDIKLYGFVTERTKSTLNKAQESATSPDVLSHWHLLDKSVGGLGFIVAGNASADWIRVGRLLALRESSSSEPWKIATIRRIVHKDQNQRIIGVSLIDREIEHVTIEQEGSARYASQPMEGYQVSDSSGESVMVGHALLLKNDTHTDELLLESSKYAHGRHYMLRERNGATRLIQLDQVKDKGEGWLLTALHIIAA